MVVEGVDARELKRAAGHIPGTALPGEPGNVGIAAHRDTFFRPLRSIARNDTITVSTLAGAYRYRVVSTKIVRPEDVQVLSPTGRTLYVGYVLPLLLCGTGAEALYRACQERAGMMPEGRAFLTPALPHL